MTPAAIAFKTWLDRVGTGDTLSEAEAEAAFSGMMSGEITPAQIGGFLMALRVRGETVEEITGAARALRARVLPIHAPPGAIDTCGTGGDGSGTFNISTAAAFVTAACGVTVAKHGNRAMSSKSGSADLLAALGVDIAAPGSQVERALRDIGIGFMFAPNHHAATRHVAPVRVELGTRTIFNLLGPLSNPAGVRHQLVGVYAAQWIEILARVLGRLGSTACWVVHGDGLDELTTTGTSEIAVLTEGVLTRFTLRPEDVGLARARFEDLAGGTPQENARITLDLFRGRRGPLRDIVLLNAAAALLIGGRVERLEQGIALGAEALDAGTVGRVLDRLVSMSAEAA